MYDGPQGTLQKMTMQALNKRSKHNYKAKQTYKVADAKLKKKPKCKPNKRDANI